MLCLWHSDAAHIARHLMQTLYAPVGAIKRFVFKPFYECLV